VDALPPNCPTCAAGHVQLLLAQQCYEWGYQSVSLLVDKLQSKKNPPEPKVISALIPVTMETWMPSRRTGQVAAE